MKYRLFLAMAALAVAAPLASPSSANREYRAEYTGAGTLVVKEPGQPATVDKGAVVCHTGSATGEGGACVRFLPGTPPYAAVHVLDDTFGEDVPFQVCLDNNGDGRCLSPDTGPCADQIFFSHDDEGGHHNPVGPLPPGFRPGCPGGLWHGYVVYLCNGVHGTGLGGHSHPATTGSITTVNQQGEGFGNVCGGSVQDPSDKLYFVQP